MSLATKVTSRENNNNNNNNNNNTTTTLTTRKTCTKRVLDPVLCLPVPSVVNSLCFVSPRIRESHCNNNNNVDTTFYNPTEREEAETDCNLSSDDDSSSSTEGIEFRSSTLLRNQLQQQQQQQEQSNRRYVRTVAVANDCLNGRYLVTCQKMSGEALLWDLQRHNQPISTIQTPRGGPGLSIRRTHNSTKVLFQTRDEEGIVSLHAIDQSSSSVSSSSSNASASSSIVRQYKTYSQTFCEASPCVNDEHLVALPSVNDNQVVVMDHRAAEPIIKTISIHGHGMLTSLAMIRCNHHDEECDDNNGSVLFLCCGMENGNIIHYNIIRGGIGTRMESSSSPTSSTYSLGKQPILSMDVTRSSTVTPFQLNDSSNNNNSSTIEGTQSARPSFLAAAGLAGDAQEVLEMSPLEAGRAVMYKATCVKEQQPPCCGWRFQQRARLSTCRVDESTNSGGGKPGVGICRFRPDDGRILAIGGWDYRVRLFERTTGRPLAILKAIMNDGTGGDGVSALDWSPDASQSGLLASACGDTKLVYLWQCFGE
jgi:hypothetical protein